MNTEEKKLFKELQQLLIDISSQNQKFREDVANQISDITQKVEKKHLPTYFENDILKVTQQSVSDAIQKVLTNFDSPLIKLTKLVVEEHSTELKTIISDSFTKVIRTDEFKQSIINAFSHKVAKTIISNNDGLFDKVANELKSDAIFKSKMAIAVSNVVEECMNNMEKI